MLRVTDLADIQGASVTTGINGFEVETTRHPATLGDPPPFATRWRRSSRHRLETFAWNDFWRSVTPEEADRFHSELVKWIGAGLHPDELDPMTLHVL